MQSNVNSQKLSHHDLQSVFVRRLISRIRSILSKFDKKIRDGSLIGKSALITGASKGMGRAIALALATEGMIWHMC